MRANFLLSSRYFDICDYRVHADNLLAETDLPPFDVIVNVIAKPDVESATLRTVQEFLRRDPDVPVINRPERVMETARDDNYRRLGELDGVIFPKTIRFAAEQLHTPAAIAEQVWAHGFTFPLLVRQVGTHTGSSFEKVTDVDALLRHIADWHGLDLFLIENHDVRIDGEHYRKMRFICVDGALYPIVCHIDRTWMVHGGNRKELMRETPWMMDEERNFLNDPVGYLGESRYRILQQLHPIIGLDYFGIDFTVTPDGKILIYETNPAIRHSFDHASGFPYLAPHLTRVSRAFRDMVTRRAEAHRNRDA